MFEEHGFEQTTVRDIAAAADVTERTFFRYFPSKEDLVLGEVLALIPLLREQVLAQPMDEPPYTAVLNALLAIAEERGAQLAILFSGPPARFMSRPSRSTPALLDFEDGVAEALAERLGAAGDEPAALKASVLARASVAAMRSTVIAYTELPEAGRSPANALRLLQEAFAYLTSGNWGHIAPPDGVS